MKTETINEFLDAGDVPASPQRYQITFAHKHQTLKRGDVVVMSETPRREHILVRISDMTAHALQDERGQYVHLSNAIYGDSPTLQTISASDSVH